MNVLYSVEYLEKHLQVDPASVELENTHVCPICKSPRITDVSILNRSLTTSWCIPCSHLFHRARPNQKWYGHWYEQCWDKQKLRGIAPRKRFSLRANLIKRIPRPVKEQVKSCLRLTQERGYGNVLLDFCLPAISQSCDVLDVGCGYGHYLQPFISYGCSAFAIEVSPHRVQAARQRGIEVAELRVEELDCSTFSKKFDLVIANHVLEHVVDPLVFLASIKKVLKEGKWVCISVPNFEREFLLKQFFNALHIHCFSKKSLITLLETSGFRVDRVMEDFQIRILARYVGASCTSANGEAARLRGFPDTPKDLIFRNTFGPNFLKYKKRRVYCQWKSFPSSDSRRIQNAYNVNYEMARNPREGALVEFTWDGSRDLPIQFKRSKGNGGVHFWAK